MRISRLIVAATLLLCGCLSATAAASQTVTLHTTFTPDKLGAPTTIEFGFQVYPTLPGSVPSPVTSIDLYLPAGVGLASSTLGLANCTPTALLESGLNGCSPNARIGFGTVLAEVPYSPETVLEAGNVTALVGPASSEHIEILFYAEAVAPVSAQLIFPGQLLSASGQFSGRLDTALPLIPTWPNGPDISVTSFSSSIGPRGLTYYRRVRGRTVRYHPLGIAVPRTCPRGGFPFRVDIGFLDGSSDSSTSTVPCPR